MRPKLYKKYLLATLGWTFFFLGVIGMIKLGMPVIDHGLSNLSQSLAGVFAVTINTDDLVDDYKYGTKKIRILIVPGHDNDYSGAVFNYKKEADLVLPVAASLAAELSKDRKLEVLLSRDPNTGAYTSPITNFLASQRDSVNYFFQQKKAQMRTFISTGDVKKNVTINHAAASSEAAYRLYAVNKWSNDNKVDVMIHLHLNDDPGRNRKTPSPGRYVGLTVYVPERQYGNAAASADLGQIIFSKLNQVVATSTNPLEKSGVVESQELIALGANGSQDGASVLVEYSYIYEPAVIDSTRWSTRAQELGVVTAQAVRNYLSGNKVVYSRL